MNTPKIIEQITKLISEWEILRRWDEDWWCSSNEHMQECIAYNSNIHSLIWINIKENNWYFLSVTKLIKENNWWWVNNIVGSLVEILKRLKSDIENWFLKWFESQISAEIFDDFLDHGALYLKEWYKNEAGVIIGITFEDIIRKLGRLNNIEEKNLEDIINKLQSNNIITSIETKRAKSCSWLRTSAAHARWEEFTKNDVEACFKFTKELISKMDDLQ